MPLVLACEPDRFHAMPRIEYRRLSIFAFVVERDRQAGAPIANPREASDDPDCLLSGDDHRYSLIEPFCRRVSVLCHNALLSCSLRPAFYTAAGASGEDFRLPFWLPL